MRNPVRTALLALALSVLVMPGIARAEDEQSRRQTYEQARVAMQAGRWDEARASYLRLWNDRHTHDVALQLGHAEYNLKRLRDATEHLAYGLMLLPPREKPEMAEKARQILAQCRQQVGAVDLRVKNKGADVVVDGKVVAEAPLVTEIFVDPGEHRFEVRLDGHASEAFTIQLAAGETKSRSVVLKPLAALSNEPPTVAATRSAQHEQPETLPPPQLPATHASWVPVVAGGIVAIAGLSAGVGFQLVRDAKRDESLRIRSRVDCAANQSDAAGDCSRLVQVASDYDTFGRLELISFVVGGAALLGTGAYFFVARPDHSKAATQGLFGALRLGAHASKNSSFLRISADF